MAEIAERRAEIVAAVGAVAPLRFVNGGGTGSLELTAREEAVTELAAGSGFYAPALFDDYSRFSLQPAAGFALPVVRRPAPGLRDRARRRLRRLRSRPATTGCRSRGSPPGSTSTASRAPARCRRRCSARPRCGCGSATASTCATPRPASSASASTASIWSTATRSSPRRPTYRGEGHAFL